MGITQEANTHARSWMVARPYGSDGSACVERFTRGGPEKLIKIATDELNRRVTA